MELKRLTTIKRQIILPQKKVYSLFINLQHSLEIKTEFSVWLDGCFSSLSCNSIHPNASEQNIFYFLFLSRRIFLELLNLSWFELLLFFLMLLIWFQFKQQCMVFNRICYKLV